MDGIALNAYYSMGYVGYEVGVDGSGENAYYRFVGCNEPDRIHRSKIRYTRNGDAYFLANGRRIRLNECLRKNLGY